MKKWLIILFAFGTCHSANADEIIDPSHLHEIKFDNIPPTKYEFKTNQLFMTVDKSSSALIFAFDKIRKVSSLKIVWQTTYNDKSVAPAAELEKVGEDFPLRVGLMVSGEPPMMPMFAPAWVKLLAGLLKFPSNQMLYAIGGSKQLPGKKWTSPYSDSIQNIAVKSQLKNGFVESTIHFPKTGVVGYWLMADGDDRKLSFVTKIKSLQIQ